MEIVLLLIPLALLFLGGAIWALFWALRKDQFDDLENASWRVVFEDREQRKSVPGTRDDMAAGRDGRNERGDRE